MKNNVLRYSIQLAMLNQLLNQKLISNKEYNLYKIRLMKDYGVLSEMVAR